MLRRLRKRAYPFVAARVHPPPPNVQLRAPAIAGEAFAERRVLVTGAAGMLGREIALAFAGEGAVVTALDRDELGLAALVDAAAGRTGAVTPVVADLTDVASLDRAVASLGSSSLPSVLVHNASVNQPRTFFSGATDADWSEVFAVNLLGPVHLTRSLLDHLKATEGSSILFMGSIDGLISSPWTAYAAAKAGVLKLMADLAVELAPHGVRVNAIAPGFLSGAESPPGSPYAPLHRFAIPPGPIVQAILYLSDPVASGFTTGATLRIDAGDALETARIREWRDR